MANTEDGFEGRLPQDGDTLFVPRSASPTAYVPSDPGERWYRLPQGYHRAGDMLVAAISEARADRANVIFAALFCYRQAVESYLKRTIDEFGDDLGPAPTNHKLDMLWMRFELISERRGCAGSNEVRAASKLVAELHSMDPGADAFRFPTARDGASFIADHEIDLDNLRAVMAGLANLFECIYLEYSHQEDAVGQMAQYSYG